MNDIIKVSIRPEKSEDQDAIYALTKRAFAPMSFAGGNEQDIINALRDQDALPISLIAEINGEILGHIAFSDALCEDNTQSWYALGPVSVDPIYQKRSIGSQLINIGIEMLIERNADGCILTGNPVYYQKFGFKLRPDLAPEGEAKSNFMALPLSNNETPNNNEAKAIINFHSAFYKDA